MPHLESLCRALCTLALLVFAVGAAQAVEWVNPKQVLPMHFGTIPLLAGTPAQFRAALDKRGLGARMVEM